MANKSRLIAAKMSVLFKYTALLMEHREVNFSKYSDLMVFEIGKDDRYIVDFSEAPEKVVASLDDVIKAILESLRAATA